MTESHIQGYGLKKGWGFLIIRQKKGEQYVYYYFQRWYRQSIRAGYNGDRVHQVLPRLNGRDVPKSAADDVRVFLQSVVGWVPGVQRLLVARCEG